MGFQRRSEKLTTEDTEITEGKTSGGHFPTTMQAGGYFTHRPGRLSEQFLSARRGFLSKRLWSRRCEFGVWMARKGSSWKYNFGFKLGRDERKTRCEVAGLFP
jgi:hypothetical protein